MQPADTNPIQIVIGNETLTHDSCQQLQSKGMDS